MSNIENYFSPTGKRVRSNSSPDQNLDFSKRSPKSKSAKMVWNISDIMSEMDKLLDKKLGLLASKEDVKQVLNEVANLREENRALKNEMSCLKIQNKELKSRLDDLEDRSRRMNLIFKGLKHDKKYDAIEVVKKFCIEVLGVSMDVVINRAHSLGVNRENCPIIANFLYDSDIRTILRNSNKLRGTEFIVHRDVSKQTRTVRALLFKLKKNISNISRDKTVIVSQNKLIVEGEVFTVEDGQLKHKQGDGFRKLSALLGQEVTSWDGALIHEDDGVRRN